MRVKQEEPKTETATPTPEAVPETVPDTTPPLDIPEPTLIDILNTRLQHLTVGAEQLRQKGNILGAAAEDRAVTEISLLITELERT